MSGVEKPCTHGVCNRNQPPGSDWWCYLGPFKRPTDYSTATCHCGVWTQGGPGGLAAHQRVVGCSEQPPAGVLVRRR